MLRLASDADVHGDILDGLHRRLPEINLVRVQDALPEGTLDPEILAWAAAENRVLITNDRNTMIGFAKSAWRRGSQCLASSPPPTSSPSARPSMTSCSLRSTCPRKRSGTKSSSSCPSGDRVQKRKKGATRRMPWQPGRRQGDILLLPCHQARSLGSFTRTSPVRSFSIRPEPESIRQEVRVDRFFAGPYAAKWFDHACTSGPLNRHPDASPP